MKKKFIVITLLIAFCSIFVAPQEASGRQRGSTGEAVLVGVGIAVVVIAVFVVVSRVVPSAKANPQKWEELHKEEELSEDSDFISAIQTGSFSSCLAEDNKQVASLYSFKVEF